MEDLVTIIVPAYNSEKCIKRCLNSVLAQTYLNIEIIVINDGSTDFTKDRVCEIANADSRVKLINNCNHGVSFSRNCGMLNAKGKYIMFVDSDDLISVDLVENMINAIEDNDFVFFGYEKLSSENVRSANEKDLYLSNDIEKDRLSVISNLFHFTKGKYIFGSCCRLFISREFLETHDILFPICSMQEDLGFVTNVFLKANKFKLSNFKGYFYDISTEGSAMKIKYRKNYLSEQIVLRDYILKSLNESTLSKAIREKTISFFVFDSTKELTVNALYSNDKSMRHIELENIQELSRIPEVRKKYIISWFMSLPTKTKIIQLCISLHIHSLVIVFKEIGRKVTE